MTPDTKPESAPHCCLPCQQYVASPNEAAAVCAFPDGYAFNTDNWNCQTMVRLRLLAEELRDALGHHTVSGPVFTVNVDQWCLVLPLPWLHRGPGYAEPPTMGDFIILYWYKHRGRCEQAYSLGDEHGCLPLRLTDAQFALTYWQELLDSPRKDPHA